MWGDQLLTFRISTRNLPPVLAVLSARCRSDAWEPRMLKSLPIQLKLILLAGVPVIGAIVLSYFVAQDAERRLESAKALGSIEDLAKLATLMSETVEAVQEERMKSSLLLGRGEKLDGALSERQALDKKIQTLTEFLNGRDTSRLPPRLASGLRRAQQLFSGIAGARQELAGPSVTPEQVSQLGDQLNSELIGATAALTGLSDDGGMLRNMGALVTVLELQERASREGALLAYVFAKKEYPAGGYKILVNLVTEQETFDKVFRQSTSQDLLDIFEGKLKDKSLDRAKQLRQIALDTMDDNFGVDPEEWYRVQGAKVRIFHDLSERLNQRVRDAALSKIKEAQNAVALARKVSLGVVASSLILALIIAVGISRSVGSLARAASDVQNKRDFSVRAQKMSNDELGKLTDIFNEMLEGIQKRDVELEHHRQNLEQLVEARTAELAKRNQAMRVVLDNVEQGLATIRPDGTLETERSLAFDQMFRSPSNKFSEVLAANDNNMRAMLELGWEGLTDGFLPPEMAVDQIPKFLTRDGRHFELSYKPMGNEAHFDGALLMVSDVTSLVEQRRKEAEQRELIAVFEGVSRDRSGFIEFFNDAERMIDEIVQDSISDTLVLRRVIHTVKGNSGIYGITSIAQVCHDIESSTLDEDRRPSSEERSRLDETWRRFAGRIRNLVASEDDVIEIQYEELERILTAVRAKKSYLEIQKLLESLRLEPTEARLSRIGEQAKRLAKQLHKGELQVNIDSGKLRLPSDVWSNFWASLVHVVRNALDHGIESPEERIAANKPEHGTITLRTHKDQDSYVVELGDDGRGIDWKRVADKAAQAGLAAASREDLVEALFHDGLTTRDEATETSGRGVGMSAVLSACKALGGHIQVVSSTGKGTTFRMVVPVLGNDQPSPLSARPGARPSLRPIAHREEPSKLQAKASGQV
jgi:two-component system, chemotaxis family, sensor kinase CheA